MERKAIKFAFRGMNQDVSEGAHPIEFFYEASNIRFLSTEDRITGGIAFEKGNEFKLQLPAVTITKASSLIQLSNEGKIIDKFSYLSGGELDKQLTDGLIDTTSGDHTIIGHATTRDSIILFSTSTGKMDCIWEVNMETYAPRLLYVRNLNFSTSNLIQGLYNYENKRIEKVYWVDGENQTRFINTKHSLENENNEQLININSNTINLVGNFNIVQPIVSDVVPGGFHTAGMVQYAYNLYRLNSSQTKISPSSELISLSKGDKQGGGALNEIVGATPVVEIKNIDPEYTHIKVYAIKYTSYNQLPSISLIKDKEIPSTKSITIFDDGKIEAEISLEEFLFLGSDPIIPKHIESKDNIMFSANIKEKSFDLDVDTRAYSFRDSNLPSYVYSEIKSSYGRATGKPLKIDPITYLVPSKHDAVNLNYDTQRFQSDKITPGGEGKYLKYEIVQDNTIENPENKQFFKDNEVYRIAIEFYNGLGQTSLPKWVADFKAPEGNLAGNYNTLKVTLKSEFYTWLNDSDNFDSRDDKPVGYRVLRADRTLNDRTIITQGFLNGFMSNIATKTTHDARNDTARKEAEDGRKLPSLQRVFGSHHKQMEPMQHYKPLSNSGKALSTNEVVTSVGGDGHVANTYQYNSIMQLFSPEVTFGNVPLYEGLDLKIRGANESEVDEFWGQEKKVSTQEIVREGKVVNGLTPYQPGSTTVDLTGNSWDLTDAGIFGPSQLDTDKEVPDTMDFYQFYRKFTKKFIPSPSKVVRQIFGKPELTEKGQGGTDYNGRPEFKYFNTMEPMLTDWIDVSKDNYVVDAWLILGGPIFAKKDRYKTPGLTSVNSWGAKCLTLMLGAPGIEPEDRPKLEELYKATKIPETNVMLVAELVKKDLQVYLGGIYGGNGYEDKKRTSYIKIGDYTPAGTDTVTILSPGDTFVQNYRFAKVTKTDTEVYVGSSNQITEIVEGRVETSIDLKNRNDQSLSAWDSRFQPRADDYHEYNRVYSQQPTLVKTNDLDFNFRKIKNFDSRIMASKLKTPGEYVDSWTDTLVNETIDLNGKFGPINGLCSFNDNIYAFQDNAFALVSINPRVQTQADDGLAIELGTGKVLHDYNYLSTTSGCLNKWGITVSNNAIYWLDALNKAIFSFSGQGMNGLSSSKGLHKFLVNNINVKNLREDNPVLNTGISTGYDVLNNDVYFTYNNQWTLCFNEKMGEFTGFYSYNSPMYIYSKEKLITINTLGKSSLYETHGGKYNEFYGVNQPSKLVLVANPEPDHECTFTNLEWKSVAQDKNKQEQRFTWETVRIYNEFQDSGEKALGPNNMRKLNRKYRIALPRNKNSTDRIRNNWAFVELTADNQNGYFYLNQSIVLHYIANYIMLR